MKKKKQNKRNRIVVKLFCYIKIKLVHSYKLIPDLITNDSSNNGKKYIKKRTVYMK